MISRRILLVGLGLRSLTVAFPVLAQQLPGKVWRIGWLGPATAASQAIRVEALQPGLRELGYIEGKNLAIDYRWRMGKA